MSLFRFTEARESRSGTYSPPSERREYLAKGSNDKSFIEDYAVGGTPAFISHDNGTLYRQNFEIEPRGFELFRVVVPYGPRKVEQGEYTVDFDTTGGTVHITQSKATVASYKAPDKPDPPDMKGAIGVRGDQIDGTETVIPALKLTVTYKHPKGIITLPQIKNLARATGKVTNTTFLTFEAGEILFLGCTGREGVEVETEIKYHFAASENVENQTFGDIVGVDKKGWEHAWIRYEDAVDANQAVKKPLHLYVERVYGEANLSALLGFG